MTIDTAPLRDADMLEGILGRSCVSLKHKQGPCPKCGGKDRFYVTAKGDRWACRQCHPRLGDAIEFVMWLEGMPFRAACEYLGWRPVTPSCKHGQEFCLICHTPTTERDQWQRARCHRCRKEGRLQPPDKRSLQDLGKLLRRYRKQVEAQVAYPERQFALIRMWDLLVWLEANPGLLDLTWLEPEATSI